MDNQYAFTFGYLALKMLGKTLYNNPFSAISELIANGFDAGAKRVYVLIDDREKANCEIEIIDSGKGMSDQEIRDKYVKVGQDNRPKNDPDYLGRKGIGKLAAFYLSNNYQILTKTKEETNFYTIDFRPFEAREQVSDEEKVYMARTPSHDPFLSEQVFDALPTGTALILHNVNLEGYGEKSFETLQYLLSDFFQFGTDEKKIFLKVISGENDLNKDFIKIEKKIAFKNMSKIYLVGKCPCENEIIKANGNIIKSWEERDRTSSLTTTVEKYDTLPRQVEINGKKVVLSINGWIGIHQTIKASLASLNDPDNFLKNNKFYHFNKVRIYVRGKLALANILPEVHNTQYYVNYIEGEIHCDELDSDDFPDIASSNRQNLDLNDARVRELINFISELVSKLINYRDTLAKKDQQTKEKKESQASADVVSSVGKSLEETKGKPVTSEDINGIKHTIANSLKASPSIIKTDYLIFLSHKREDKYIADFIYYYLISHLGFLPEMIFYTSKDGGVEESETLLEQQINESLTTQNSYVIFCISSGLFKGSEFCMFEGGAAWAVKQKEKIGLLYTNYECVPTYLKSMKKESLFVDKPELDRNEYAAVVRLLNSAIDYLNHNYADESKRKPLLSEEPLPDDAELNTSGKKADAYFDKTIVDYWNSYIKPNWKNK